MKTLLFISLNNCFASIHVVVRSRHANRDFVADNDYANFIQIAGLFECQRLKKRVPYVARAEEQVVYQTRKHLQLSTGNKKQFIVTNASI